MDFPVWHVPYLGGSMVIAIIAIVHVFIAHFAVGAGIVNAVTETLAIRHNHPTVRQFLRDHSHLLILLAFIGGSITGVGIWFSISLVSPDATGMLIHLFLWAWAIEWIFFLVEIIAGYIYYYTWDRLSPRSHCLIGWIYAIAAFMSLVFINGILSFMLSPGAALDSSVQPMRFDFWAGLFNPTYWPSLVLRTISSLAIVALFIMVMVNASKRYSPQQRDDVVRHGGKFLLPLIGMVPAAAWYFYESPPEAVFYIQGGAIAMTLLFAFSLAASTLIGFYSYVAIIIRKRSVNLETAILLMFIALIATGSSEFVREGIRKPYLIWDHMYSSGLLKSQVASLQAPSSKDPNTSILRYSRWSIRPQDSQEPLFSDADFLDYNSESLAAVKDTVRGRWIYDGQCLRCHCIDGYNAVRPLVHQWPPKMIVNALRELDKVKSFMPPFVGNRQDRDDLAAFLHSLNDPDYKINPSCMECHKEDVDNPTEAGDGEGEGQL
jgi:cytochrome bd-type quinol oxidase subunit 1